jgi:hypothetical protein
MSVAWGNAEIDPAALPLEGVGGVLDAFVRTEVAHGLYLRAPRAVSLDRSSTVPLLVGLVAHARELAPRDVLERAVLVAVDRDGGPPRAAAFADAPPPVGTPGEWGPGDATNQDPPGRPGAVAVRLRAPAALALTTAPGRLVLSVLSGDRVSNPCDLDVVPDARRFEPAPDGDVPPAPAPPAPVWPTPNPLGGAPHYQRTADSPPVPEQPGIVLVGPEVVSMQRGTPSCVLHGSFRLAVDPRASQGATLRTHGVAMVVTGSEDGRPAIAGLQLPSFGAPSDAPAPTVTGHFMLDLVSLLGLPHRSGTLHVRAFAGWRVSEPLVFRVVA